MHSSPAASSTACVSFLCFQCFFIHHKQFTIVYWLKKVLSLLHYIECPFQNLWFSGALAQQTHFHSALSLIHEQHSALASRRVTENCKFLLILVWLLWNEHEFKFSDLAEHTRAPNLDLFWNKSNLQFESLLRNVDEMNSNLVPTLNSETFSISWRLCEWKGKWWNSCFLSQTHLDWANGSEIRYLNKAICECLFVPFQQRVSPNRHTKNQSRESSGKAGVYCEKALERPWRRRW